MNRVETSRAPISIGARLLMLLFVGLVAVAVVLRGLGATWPESAAVGVLAGVLLAVVGTLLRR